MELKYSKLKFHLKKKKKKTLPTRNLNFLDSSSKLGTQVNQTRVPTFFF